MIKCRKLSKLYGNLVAVDNVSFTAEAGRVVGLVGPNAAGKSTLIKLIAGFAQPSSGAVLLNNAPPAAHDQLAQQVGVLSADSGLPSQAPVLFYLRETARLVGISRKTLDETIEQLGLGPVIGQRFVRLSLGTQRRVMLALALMPQPGTLVLDEPMNGLDPNSARALGDLVRDRATSQGTCVLLASHLVAELARVSDDLVVLGSGRVLYKGTAEGLIGDDPGILIRVIKEDQQRFESLLNKVGFQYTATGEDIMVQNTSCAQIGRLCAEYRVAIRHLSEAVSSLEEAYFTMTAEHTDLRATPIHTSCQPYNGLMLIRREKHHVLCRSLVLGTSHISGQSLVGSRHWRFCAGYGTSRNLCWYPHQPRNLGCVLTWDGTNWLRIIHGLEHRAPVHGNRRGGCCRP